MWKKYKNIIIGLLIVVGVAAALVIAKKQREKYLAKKNGNGSNGGSGGGGSEVGLKTDISDVRSQTDADNLSRAAALAGVQMN